MCLVESYLDKMVTPKSLQIHYQASHSRGHGTQRITHQKTMLKSHGLLNQLNVHSEEQGESDGRD